MPRRALKTYPIPPEVLPPLTLGVRKAAETIGWPIRTFTRHIPYIKSYLIRRPGSKRPTRLIDAASLKAYLESFAEGPDPASNSASVDSRKAKRPAESKQRSPK